MRGFTFALGFIAILSANAQAQSLERGYIDVNFGLAMASEDQFSGNALLPYDDQESIRLSTTYQLPRGASFDFGGGVMITEFVGVGVSFTGTAHKETAAFAAEVPHPRFLNNYGRGEDTTIAELERVEGGVNIHGMFVLPTGPDLRVRVFGGPTYFRVQQDLINDIEYNQVWTVSPVTNRVTLTNSFVNKYEATGWGFHAGADISYFFTRVFGVGGVARFSRGTTPLDDFDAADSGVDELKAGGFQVGGGIRLKF